MGFNIVAPYMEFLHLNWYIPEWLGRKSVMITSIGTHSLNVTNICDWINFEYTHNPNVFKLVKCQSTPSNDRDPKYLFSGAWEVSSNTKTPYQKKFNLFGWHNPFSNTTHDVLYHGGCYMVDTRYYPAEVDLRSQVTLQTESISVLPICCKLTIKN